MFDFFFLTQKTAYEMRLSDWSSVVFSSDLEAGDPFGPWRELADRFQERGIGFGSRACGDREAGGKRGRDRAQQVGVAEKQPGLRIVRDIRSEEHTSELQSLMRISYAVFCLKKKKHKPRYSGNYVLYVLKSTVSSTTQNLNKRML